MLFLHSGKKIINVVHYICLKIGQRWLSLHCLITCFFCLFGFVLFFCTLFLHSTFSTHHLCKFKVFGEGWVVKFVILSTDLLIYLLLTLGGFQIIWFNFKKLKNLITLRNFSWKFQQSLKYGNIFWNTRH